MINNSKIIGLMAAVLTTAAFVPQVYKTWKSKSADSLSLTMYIVFFTGVILWLIYGIQINSLSIIIANSVTSILTLLLIIFKRIYK
jgi:MtN3 and saliva related transmembrane protein